jgi:hypothetical protein
MIPRYQAVLFVVLLVASAVMSTVLWQLRERSHQRLLAGEDSAPTYAPIVAESEQATLFVANDTDSSMLAQVQSLPLPEDSGSRARAVLGKLLDLYAAPDAAHPVPGGSNSIAQVFLLAAPTVERPRDPLGPDKPVTQSKAVSSTGPQLAVVNLTGSFVAGHPSGLQTESLTVLSICATLHANLPRVTQVRFLVDGVQRPTLAGHADLTRTYLAAEAVPSEGAHP